MAGLPAHARRDALAAVCDELRRRRDDLVDLLVLETGKPLADCRTETDRAIMTVQAATEEVGRIHGETVALDMSPAGEGMTGFWSGGPIGVVIGITGFNYPLLLAAHKIAPAIAAGCPVICKPAPQAPLAVLQLAALCRAALRQAGGPAAGVQVVTGDAAVGSVSSLIGDRRGVLHRIRVRFDHIAATRAGQGAAGARLQLRADRDPRRQPARRRRRRRPRRLLRQRPGLHLRAADLVDEDVAEEFTSLLARRVAELRTGDPRLASTNVATLIDATATSRVRDWVTAAVHAGARVLTPEPAGGDTAGALGPVILADVPEDCDVWAEEVFGPVVCLRTVSGLDEAIEVATPPVRPARQRVHQFAEYRADRAARLEVGGVVINEVPDSGSTTCPTAA